MDGANGYKIRCDECKWLKDPDDLISYLHLFLCSDCYFKDSKAMTLEEKKKNI